MNLGVQVPAALISNSNELQVTNKTSLAGRCPEHTFKLSWFQSFVQRWAANVDWEVLRESTAELAYARAKMDPVGKTPQVEEPRGSFTPKHEPKGKAAS